MLHVDCPSFETTSANVPVDHCSAGRATPEGGAAAWREELAQDWCVNADATERQSH